MAASFRLNFTQTIRFSVGTIRQKTTNVGLKKKMKQPSVQNYLHQYLRLKKMYSSSWEILSSRNSQFPKTY